MRSIQLAALSLLPLMMLASAASGRARDDVMAAAYRCARIAGSRLWLDCYYGAAQPVRTALNLPSATPEQVSLAASPPDGGAPEDVDLRGAVLANASNCYALGDDRKWLDCYYASAQSLRERLGLSTAPPRMGTNSFGLPPRPAMAREPAGATSAMADYKFDDFGKFTVRLNNGQVWRQLASDTVLAHWLKPPAEYVVEVRKGAFGSYNLTVEHTGGSYKVQRIQ